MSYIAKELVTPGTKMERVYIPVVDMINGIIDDADGHPHKVLAGTIAVVERSLCVIARVMGRSPDGRLFVGFADASTCWVRPTILARFNPDGGFYDLAA